MRPATRLALVCACGAALVGCHGTAPSRAADEMVSARAPDARTAPTRIPKGADRIRAPAPFHAVTLEDRESTKGIAERDRFRLCVEREDGRSIEMTFTAAYGNVTIDVIPALPGGEALLCLQAGHGRGTNVHAETLSLFRLTGPGLARVAWLPLSWWTLDPVAGMRHRRWEWSVIDADGDGTAEITLTAARHSDATTNPGRHVYRWHPASARFIAPPGAPETSPTPNAMARHLGWSPEDQKTTPPTR